MVEKWYDMWENVSSLANHMFENGEDFKNILYMIEKPWKYTEEFKEMESEEE